LHPVDIEQIDGLLGAVLREWPKVASRDEVLILV
jgi:hypothetical protein